MLISLLPWMAFAEPAQEPPSPIPPLNDLLRLPSPVSLELAYVAEPTYSLPDSLFNYAHGFELAAQLSTGFGHDDPASWKEIDHWILTFDAQQYYSPSDLAADMGVVNPSQEIANPNGLYLGELSLTRSPGNDPIYLKVGSISMDADFLSPEITGMYTHAAFNNQYNVSMEVFPISPVNALGAVLGYSLPGNLDLRAGIYQQNSIRADMDRQGWEFDVNGDDGLVELIQLEGNIGDSPETIGLCPPEDHTFSWHSARCVQDGEVINELPAGSWQVGAFFSQGEKVNDTRNPSHGAYANLTIPVDIDIGVGHRFWMSGVYGFQPENNPVPMWLGTGWVTQGLLEKRHLDLIILGFSWSQLSFDDWSQRELLVEMEYGIVLTDSIIVLPNVQWYIESPGIDTRPVTMGIGIHAGL